MVWALFDFDVWPNLLADQRSNVFFLELLDKVQVRPLGLESDVRPALLVCDQAGLAWEPSLPSKTTPTVTTSGLNLTTL